MISGTHTAREPILTGERQGTKLGSGTGWDAGTAIEWSKAPTPAMGGTALTSTTGTHALVYRAADGLFMGDCVASHGGCEMENREGRAGRSIAN